MPADDHQPDSTRTLAPERSTLTPEQLLAVERLIDAFEDDLRAGQSPDLSAVVEQGPPATRRVLVRELLHLQLAYRPPLDRAAAEHHYRGRFPDYADQVAAVFRPPASTRDHPPAPSTVPGDAVGPARPASAPTGGPDRYAHGAEIARPAPATARRTLLTFTWYGGGARRVEAATGTCHWYKGGINLIIMSLS